MSKITQPAKKRKTITIEEKAVIFQNILYATHEVYSLKELETIIPRKSQGVIHSMLVKELIEYMNNENMIKVEKCGNINVYYSFPFVSVVTKELQLNRLLGNKTTLSTTCETLQGKKDNLLKVLSFDSPGEETTIELNAKYKLLSKKLTSLENGLSKMEIMSQQNNLLDFEKQIKENNHTIEVCKENINIIVDYLLLKFPNLERKQLLQEIDLSEDLISS